MATFRHVLRHSDADDIEDDPVLMRGEPGIIYPADETSDPIVKLGDGTSPLSELPEFVSATTSAENSILNAIIFGG